NREVHEAGIFIGGDLRPDAGVAVEGPRVLFPRVVAELARTRNRVPRPDPASGPHVERTHNPFGVVVRDDRHPLFHRRADDDGVFHDERRRVHADLAGLEIDLLSRADDRALFQIDNAAAAERGDGLAGLRVQRYEPIAGRDEQYAIVTLAVGPVRDAASRQLPWRDSRARAFAHAVDPVQFAGLGVERYDRASRAAGRVERPFDDERRAFQLVLGPRAEVVGPEAPGDLELAEIRGVDLIEW